MALLSIVVPCYNEEEAIPVFYDNIISLQQELLTMEFELVFVDDGSTDDTYSVISKLRDSDRRVKAIRFSRNFGKEAAIFSGLNQAKGDCCVVMDADLQHPVDAIPEMVAFWQEGYEVVEGIKSNRGEESGLRKTFANFYYRIFSRFMGMDVRNTSDFKLMDRKVVDALCNLKERNTFFRALSFWVGFKHISVTYEVAERVAGETKWSNRSLFQYGLKNLVSFSFIPLYSIFFVGVILFVLGVVLSVDAILSVLQGTSVGGYPTILIFLAFIASGIMISLGVIGVYIAMIFDEVKGRPRYIISEKSDE